jgi:hypothetical protein
MKLALLWLCIAAIADSGPVSYTNVPSERALHIFQKMGSRDPKILSESEKVEWVRSRLAWIALLRLQGKENDALEAFTGCDSWCGKLAPSLEWGALKRWGCARKPDSGPCNEKTKT